MENRKLSKCCNSDMQEESNQCITCGACGICGGYCVCGKERCGNCVGNGWTTEHNKPETHSPEDGSCLNCPIQEPCVKCNGTGFNL